MCLSAQLSGRETRVHAGRALETGGENGKIGTNRGQMSKTVAPVEEENEDEQKQKRMMIPNTNYTTR